MQGEASCLEFFVGGWLRLGELFAGSGLVEGVGVFERGERGLEGPEDRIMIDAQFLCLVYHISKETGN